MDVYVIPIGRDRYELYCEMATEAELAAAAALPPPSGFFASLRHKFGVMLKAAEERQQGRAEPAEGRGWLGRMQDSTLEWVAKRIAEQRLLWNLRHQTAVVAAHPQDMSFDQVNTLIRRTLQRDYDRHRRWLVVDSLGLIASGAVMLVPGPNVLAYYFAFRVVGHWLCMRGADQGLVRVRWTGRPCPPLTELRECALLEPDVRDARVNDIAARLRLQHLSAFFDRVAIPHA